MKHRSEAVAVPRTLLDRGPPPDPWALVWGQPYIDSTTLAGALEADLESTPQPDFRTRLLVRDSAVALREYWGARRFGRWLARSPVGERIRRILKEDLGEPGFTAIRRRLVDRITSVEVGQIFTMLGHGVHDRVEVYVAGSIPTLIQGLTARPTNDIDIVNEVPEAIRRQRAVLEKIEIQFGLTLGHVQAYYLPANWQQRRQWLGDYGGLRVYLVDVYDIFVSKLSSKLEKHQLDLRVLASKLDKEKAKDRLLGDGRPFLDDTHLRPQIEENWRFIFQEPLFPAETEGEAKPPAPAKEPRKGRSRKEKGKGLPPEEPQG
jgi:hypothetical protein